MDSRADAAVRELWQSLFQAGIPSQPLSAGARPHISLCLYESLDPGLFRKKLEAFASQAAPLYFLLESVGSFPSADGVVFLAPHPSDPLLDLHRRFHKDFEGYVSTASRHYLPGYWKPHCTLAQKLSSDQVGQAIAVCRRAALPIRGQFTQIGLIEYRPIKEICVFEFGRS
jgi:2'-5' RNA ligase